MNSNNDNKKILKKVVINIFLAIFFILTLLTIMKNISENAFINLKYSIEDIFTLNIKYNDGYFINQYISEEQFNKIKNIDTVEDLALLTSNNDHIYYDRKPYKARVFGISPSYWDFQSNNIIYGREINKGDILFNSNVVVITEDLAYKMFSSIKVVGDYIELNGLKFKIIGILENKGDFINYFVEDEINNIYVPISSSKNMYGQIKGTKLFIKANNESNIEFTKLQIEALMKSSYKECFYEIKEYEKLKKISFQPYLWVCLLLILFLVLKIVLRPKAYLHNTKLIIFYLSNLIYSLFSVFTLIHNVYIPKKYIVDNFIELDKYKDIFKSIIVEANNLRGFDIIGIDNLADKAFKINIILSLAIIIIGGYFFIQGILFAREADIGTKKILYASILAVFLSKISSIFFIKINGYKIFFDIKFEIITMGVVLLPIIYDYLRKDKFSYATEKA